MATKETKANRNTGSENMETTETAKHFKIKVHISKLRLRG